MVHIPAPVPRLCLSYEFDIATTKHESVAQHDAAIKKAAQIVDDITSFSKYGVTAEAFSAKVINGKTIDPDHQLTLNKVHNSPFDPNFHVPKGGPAVRYEFIYADKMDASTSDKLFIRIVTSFGKVEEVIDGVLATRIALTAMEILEGNETHPTIFPQLPPLHFGFRHILNFLYHNVLNGILTIPFAYLWMYIYISLETVGLKGKPNLLRVNDAVSLLRFHSSEYKDEVATYHMYRSDEKGAYKTFIAMAEQWKKNLGYDAYFHIVNFSPFSSPAITYNIQDVCNKKDRYKGILVPPGPPADEDIWFIINYATAKKMVLNNYGNHKHNFSAKPVNFLWDWLHVRSTGHVCCSISINGVFLGCFRGLESSFQHLSIPEETFPSPATAAKANVAWRTFMK
jgi:hypothetical protein